MNTKWDLPGFHLDLSQLQTPDNPAAQPDALEAAHRKLDRLFTPGGEVGFFDLPFELKNGELDAIVATARSLKGAWEHALVLGIGGSYLGAASAIQALAPVGPNAITWVSNIDPPAIEAARQRIRQKRHACLVISKSGNTTETLSAFYHLSQDLDPRGFVIVTDPHSGELRRLAQKYGWNTLEVPPNVGGRFSMLTAVGLLPCALVGVDPTEILDGACAMRERLQACAPTDNPAYALAACLYDWDTRHGHGIQYLMPYWSTLSLFAQWYVQLWGESLGKKTSEGKHTGPTPVAALGTTDQHSLLQLFNEGPRNKVVGFMDIEAKGRSTLVGKPPFEAGASGYLCNHSFEKISSEACQATQQSLTNAKVPTYRITLANLTPQAMGALYFFFETATAFAGELYGVNAFDQPGVEESKRLLHAALS